MALVQDTLVNKIMLILGDTFGTDGAMQSYHYGIAEQIIAATQDEHFTPIMIDNIVYAAYMDAVAATQVTDALDEIISEG